MTNTTIAPPLLQLDWSYYERINIEANPDFKKEAPSILKGEAYVSVVCAAEDKTKYKATVQARNFSQKDDDNNPPLFYDIVIQGFFTVDKDHLDKVVPLLHLTGSSMLYGSIREILMMITGRFENGTGTVILPTIDPRTGFNRDVDPES